MNAPNRKRRSPAADAPRQLDLFGVFVPHETLRDLVLRIEDPVDFLGALDRLQDLGWLGVADAVDVFVRARPPLEFKALREVVEQRGGRVPDAYARRFVELAAAQHRFDVFDDRNEQLLAHSGVDAAHVRALLDQAVTANAMGLCMFPASVGGLWFWLRSGARWAYDTAAERVEWFVQAFCAMVPEVEESLRAPLTEAVLDWLDDADAAPDDRHAALALLDATRARWARILDAERVEPRFAALGRSAK
jgi:hypothetical protein